MWGEVIEHQHGWRSEYAAVRSIIKITGAHWLLLELREKYRCTEVTELLATPGGTVLGDDWLTRMEESSRCA
jgi:hypothetical protein